MLRFFRPVALACFFAFASSCAVERPLSAAASSLEAFGVMADVVASIRISEIHYDNAGTDAGEAIEISGPAGASVEGWSIVLYNGSGGAPYEPTRVLRGSIPASCGSRGVVVETYPSNGVQNGAPDGIALVDAGGNVVEFLSYEGTLVASSGPALGLRSREIDASQSGSDAAGLSLQRRADEGWSAPAASTFGACNDSPAEEATIASVTVTGSASLFAGMRERYEARAFDASGAEVKGTTVTWSSSDTEVAHVSTGGIVTARAPGSAQITATASGDVAGSFTVEVVEVVPLPPTETFISEIHYDNDGTDVGEAIEIEGPAGTSVNNWRIVLYNGSNGLPYDTRTLTGSFPSQCGGRGTLAVTYPTNGIQNGSPDGVALVNASGAVVEFISYEGALRAADGPAIGRLATNLPVDEAGEAPGRSLQRDALGWYGPATASFGSCNVAPAPFVSFTGRTAADPALPVGYEDQLFATLNDGRGGTTPAPFTWTSETPDIATIDADGVVHALAAGIAILRATADNGATGTISLPTHVAQPAATASYGNHTEFGIPRDANPNDDFIVRREQYTSSFNGARGIPNWVSMNLEATHFGAEDRCDCFTFDPDLPAEFRRYTTADYTGAGEFHGYGIDRGHLARSFDRTAGSLDNATTYLFSNIIPQAADNNQGPWSAMEMEVGDLARLQDREVYIIAGASGSKGTVKNEGLITIPTHVWKVVVVMPRDQGLSSVNGSDDVQVLAVIMPNEPGIRGNDWRDYLTTVNAVESLSGYDVLDLLADDIERLVEAGFQDERALIDALAADARVSAGTANSLRAKLDAAAGSLDHGNATAARNQLNALLNELNALVRSGRLAATDATVIRDAILAFIRTL
jgi:DNA/RNA endonuclease G (NUC1)